MISLFPHQQEALQETKDFDNIAVYHDMGLGKTFTGSEMMKRFGCKVNLIVCQKSKVQDWVEHFTDNYQMQVFDLTNKKQLGEYHGLSQGQRFFIVGVINYELAWRRKELLDLYDFTLMLDESSLIQNQKAKQTKFILKMKPAHVILLSGTPVGGKYENLWTQVHLLGWKISEDLYNRQYVNWTTIDSGGFQHKIVDKEDPYKNIDRLKSKMREHGAIFKKTEECYAWCATFVSAVAVKLGYTRIIPTECSCNYMIKGFQQIGCWVENDAYVPKAGDVIFYDWQDLGIGDNVGSSDHVGIVEKCDGKTITVIEGNISNKVGRRTLAVNGKYIRGFGVPAYTTQSASTPAPSTTKKDITTIAKEVLAGQWGNGDDRKNRLTNAGYDYATVQAKVNELVSGKTSTPTKSVAEVAKEVLAGKWGNGTARKTALENAGYNYSEVQQKVNELCGQKSVTEVAKEVIQGKWGNGATRKSKLEQAGYNYSAVQAEVNRLLR